MPAEIGDLLEELEALGDETVGTIESSRMIVATAQGNLEFNKEECEKLLQDESTVQQFFDALGVSKASIELYALELTDPVLDKIRELFDPVDEY